jgi:hypothetical protein
MNQIQTLSRRMGLALSLMPLLLGLSGCGGQSVAGKYQCDGIPGSDTLLLGSDGTAVQQGDMLGHQMMGTGTYKSDGGKITVTITSLTADGAKTDIPQDRQETVFERQDNGDLKWILSTCRKV